jgi:AAA+ ATPase superfamily predicted ATPase
MIGLLGSHRVGKSTLAREFAKKHDALFLETSASAVFKELGYDPAVTYDFSTRLTIQEEILKRFDEMYAAYSCRRVITDRSPMDMLAYTMSEAIGNSVAEHDQERFRKYAQDCFDVTNKRFTLLLLVQPGIKLVEAEGKAALNEAYIEHLNTLSLGLSVDERVDVPHFYIPRYMTDIDDRVEAVAFALERTIQRARREREALGVELH